MSSFNASFWLAVLFFIVIHFVMVWDFLSAFGIVPWQTVSFYVQEWSGHNPFLPFLAGLVIGHLFFGRSP